MAGTVVSGSGLVAGRYRVVEELGRGGMGVVYQAVDEVLGREVAIKELRTFADASGAELSGLRVRMQREARAAARVRHPSVVAVHDVVEAEDGRPVIVMELVDGRSLDDVVRERGALPPAEAAAIGAKVAEALGAAHDAGVLHRDVKPGNILIESGGRVLLTDFGIAAIEEPDDGPSAQLTQHGQLVGSLDYLAPERAQGLQPGPASDVWSLGAMLFAVVEGASPFRGTSTWSTLNAIVTEPLPQPRRAGQLAPVLAQLLAKDPRARPDARQAARSLAAVAAAPAAAATGPHTLPLDVRPAPVPTPVPTPVPAPVPAPVPVPAAQQTPRPGWTPPRPEGPTRPEPGWRPPVGGPAVAARPDDAEPRGGRRRLVVAAVVAGVLLVGGGVAWTLVGRTGGGREQQETVAQPGDVLVSVPAAAPSGTPGHRRAHRPSPARSTARPVSSPTATHRAAAPTAAPRPKPKPTTPPPPAWKSCTYYSGTAQTQYPDTGAAVKEVQCILVARGYSVGPSGVDGQFGPDTESAVKSFQTARHLEVDGQVGPQTWGALRS